MGPLLPLISARNTLEQYGFTNPTTDFRNSNQSSHFPYAAQIWKSMWAQQSGMNVDGVIAIDPVALSYILGAVGPVTMPDGEVITQDNVVELTESTAYRRFPTDQIARKKYLQDIANEVVKKMTGRIESPRKLLDALGKAVSERRIAVWSSSPADQTASRGNPARTCDSRRSCTVCRGRHQQSRRKQARLLSQAENRVRRRWLRWRYENVDRHHTADEHAAR